MQIFLDDSVARGFGYDDGKKDIASLKAIRAKGHTVHLADGAVLELLTQLVEGRFAWPDWVRARRALLSLLDPLDPVPAGGWQILDKVGMCLEQTLTEDEHEENRRRLRGGWKMLTKSRRLAEINRVEGTRARGKIVVTRFDAAGAPRVCDEIKSEWTDGMLSLESSLGSAPSFDDFVKEMAAKFDRRIQSTPPASVRLEAFLRVNASFALQRLRPKNPYNPVKKANDGLDVDLLRYLAVPAIVCTKDKRLQRVVAQAGSWQRRWVLRPAELERQVVHGSLSLDWP
jgi:hypothetical protein